MMKREQTKKRSTKASKASKTTTWRMARDLELAHHQIANWEVLRRFGFDTDQIFVGIYNGGEVFTTLRVGGKEIHFPVSKGVKLQNPRPFMTIYAEACETWNRRMTAEQQMAIFRRHVSEDDMLAMAAELRMHDVDIPNMPDAPTSETLSAFFSFANGNFQTRAPATEGSN